MRILRKAAEFLAFGGGDANNPLPPIGDPDTLCELLEESLLLLANRRMPKVGARVVSLEAVEDDGPDGLPQSLPVGTEGVIESINYYEDQGITVGINFGSGEVVVHNYVVDDEFWSFVVMNEE